MMRLVRVAVLTTLLTFPLVGIATATVWHVPSEVPTIAGALAAAAEGDTVLVACGTYYEHDVQLTPGVSLIGAGGGPVPCTVIDAQGLGDVLIMMGGRTPQVLMNLCLRNGHDGIGDSALSEGSLEAINCRIEGNANGIENLIEQMRLVDCLIAGNTGWGVRSNTGTSLRMERCRVLQNLGGAIATGEAYVELRDCLIADNHATGSVIGFLGPEGYFSLEGCTITRNTSLSGSVIACNDQWTLVELTRTIIAENDAPAIMGLHYPVPVALSCCDIWNNDGGSFAGQVDVQYTGPNNSEDPRFCDPAAGDYHLAAGSPCLPENSGPCGLIGALGAGGCDLTAAPPPPGSRFGFTGAIPNPFNPRTTVSFSLESAVSAEVTMSDVSGRRVRRLLKGTVLPAGTHAVTWDGRDDQGRVLPAGLYICRLRAGQRTDVRRLVLIK